MFCQILPRLNIERSTLREFPSPFCSVTTWPLRFPGAIETEYIGGPFGTWMMYMGM